jgi:hypothetical protein
VGVHLCLCPRVHAWSCGCVSSCVSTRVCASVRVACVQSETFYRLPVAGGGGVAGGASEKTSFTGGPLSPGGNASEPHEFVQHRIMQHPIWLNLQLWEEAFYR